MGTINSIQNNVNNYTIPERERERDVFPKKTYFVYTYIPTMMVPTT